MQVSLSTLQNIFNDMKNRAPAVPYQRNFLGMTWENFNRSQYTFPNDPQITVMQNERERKRFRGKIHRLMEYNQSENWTDTELQEEFVEFINPYFSNSINSFDDITVTSVRQDYSLSQERPWEISNYRIFTITDNANTRKVIIVDFLDLDRPNYTPCTYTPNPYYLEIGIELPNGNIFKVF